MKNCFVEIIIDICDFLIRIKFNSFSTKTQILYIIFNESKNIDLFFIRRIHLFNHNINQK